MLAHERQKKIIDILEREDSVKVSNLMKLFQVSIETIRRDLDNLEKEGYLKKVYGGAVRETINAKESSFNIREAEFVEEKKEIASIAIRYISEGQSIALNGGTTTLEIAKLIKGKFKKLTIITNSIAVALELSNKENFKIILSGGIFNGTELTMFGDFALETISKLRIDTAFISVSGVSLVEGLTDYSFEEVQIQRKLLDIAQQKIVLNDSSKFNTISLLKVCDFSKINLIITDSKLNKNILKKYIDEGIDVINT